MAYKWTDEEVELLKAKINTNIKAADIAAQMNIPVREVYEKSSQLRKAGELERVREFKPRSTPPKNAPQAADAEEVSKLKAENKKLTEDLQRARNNDKTVQQALHISQLNDKLRLRDEEQKTLMRDIYKYKNKIAELEAALEAAKAGNAAEGLDVAELKECVGEITLSTLLTESQQETLVIMITKTLEDLGESTPSMFGTPIIFQKIFKGNGPATERIIALVEILKLLTGNNESAEDINVPDKKEENDAEN